MKGLSILIVSFFIFASCNLGPNNGKTSLNDGEVWPIIETVLAEGVEISDVRPDASTLSEKEILVKIAKIASEEGYLSLSHPLYSTDQPKLLNARIETPILVHDLDVPVQDVYKSSSYLLNAVDDFGESLLNVYANPSPDNDGYPQYGSIGVTLSNATAELSRHYITKREAQKIIESQFPGQQYKGPIAVRMSFEGDMYGLNNVSWYFTVEGNSSRSAMGGNDHKEYLINALVTKYRELPDEVTAPASRSLIDAKKSNPGFTFYSRMVQLTEPIYFLENLDNMKAGRSIMGSNNNPPVPAQVTSVPLK